MRLDILSILLIGFDSFPLNWHLHKLVDRAYMVMQNDKTNDKPIQNTLPS